MTRRRIGGDVMLPGGGKAPFPKAICVNGFVFLSGQLGLDASGKIVTGGIKPQTHQALENIKAVLSEAGAGLEDVVKVTAWIGDSAHFKDFNEVYASYFTQLQPARSTVVGALLLPGALVEIEAIAVPTLS